MTAEKRNGRSPSFVRVYKQRPYEGQKQIPHPAPFVHVPLSRQAGRQVPFAKALRAGGMTDRGGRGEILRRGRTLLRMTTEKADATCESRGQGKPCPYEGEKGKNRRVSQNEALRYKGEQQAE